MSRLMPAVLRHPRLDLPVTFAMLGNLVSFVLGPVTALLVATRFSPALQGYYYAFGSLTALQFIVELGLGQAIIQFASHEWAELGFDSRGRVAGAANARSRLVSLGRLAFKWYALGAVILLFALLPGGYYFFAQAPGSRISWAGPWTAVCIALAVNLLLTPAFFLLQGCNQVAEYWFYRLIQQIVNSVTLWVAILAGAKLWASPIAMTVGLAWSAVFLLFYTPFIQTFFRPARGPRIHWKREVWPIQWRIAISWFSAYFVLQLFTPVLFQIAGPVPAGQLGLTITLTNVLLAISTSWVVTKAPMFGGLVARAEHARLDATFFRALWLSVAMAILGALLIWLSIVGFNRLGLPIGQRILSPVAAAPFLASVAVSSVLVSLSVYLRAHKREPLVWVFFGGSLALALLVAPLARWGGAFGIGAGYLMVLSLFQLPLSVVIFVQARRTWRYVKGG